MPERRESRVSRAGCVILAAAPKTVHAEVRAALPSPLTAAGLPGTTHFMSIGGETGNEGENVGFIGEIEVFVETNPTRGTGTAKSARQRK
jgi:hypothetical protein